MADSMIPELSIASALSGAESFYIIDESSDVKISPVQLAQYIVESYQFDTTNDTENSITGAINQLNAIGTDTRALLLSVHPIGSLYWSSSSKSPAELFGGTWTQIKDRFILAAGNTFAVKQTGGEETHTLTVAEMPSHSHGGKTSAPGNNKTGKPSKTTTGNNSQAHQHSIPKLSGTALTCSSHTHTITVNGDSGGGNGANGSVNMKGQAIRWITTTSNGDHGHTFTTTKSTSGQDSADHKHTMAHTHNLQNHTHSLTAEGGSAHNNMPPYVAKYCWERIS